MIIDSYQIASKSAHYYSRTEIAGTSIWLKPKTPSVLASAQKNASGVSLSLSDMGKQMIRQAQERAQQNQQLVRQSIQDQARQLRQQTPIFTAAVDEVNPLLMNPEDFKKYLLELFFYHMTGKRFEIRMPTLSGTHVSSPELRLPAAAQAQRAQATMTRYTSEMEFASYSATGVVNTADGKRIDISVNLNMSRSFEEYIQTTLNLAPPGNVCDPLIINYGGMAASLTQTKFSFDLTLDGNPDSISFAGPGSGFLVLDRNGDGKINDGSEMFGPRTGSGFGELRTYDSDSNLWIDEADAIYSQLRIWSKDEHGNDQLFTLKELDIGAIYLGDMFTQFSITGSDAANADGQVRSTSFFLKDSGGAGTIQHIDLTL